MIIFFVLLYKKIFEMILTKQKAFIRSACIQKSSISYKFVMNLSEGLDYNGFALIKFKVNKEAKNHQLFLDCSAKKIVFLKINGSQAQTINRQNKFLYLQSQFLNFQPDQINIVYVEYESCYDNDSNGLITFRDKQNRQYVYTIFQPYNAHRVFPVFDQPDLKAKMQLILITEQSWKNVISNQLPKIHQKFSMNILIENFPEIKQSKKFINNLQIRHNIQITIFSPTVMLSPYIYCLNAGPYQFFEIETQKMKLPMRVYSSASMFPILKKMQTIISEITLESMIFLNDFLGVKYPFSKYDQLFVGEYQKIAMENAGSCIFTDQYLDDPNYIYNQKLFWMINTLVHELSHHWFGNLVSVVWWDDLWLNEGFAQFFGFYCLEKIKDKLKYAKFNSSLAHFIQTRSCAFDADCSQTVRPVYYSNQTISMAVANFQGVGISYTKGASLVFQLMQLIGEDNLSKGLELYLNTHAFSNATIDNLLESLKPYLPKHQLPISLSQWKKQWLETVSFITVQPQIEHKGYILKIKHPNNNKSYVNNKISIAFIDQNMNQTIITTSLFSGSQTQMLLTQQMQNSKSIILNYGNHSYIKEKIDINSLNYLIKNYHRISDILIKAQFWQYLYRQIKDKNISAFKFIDLGLNFIEEEVYDCIFERILKIFVEIKDKYIPTQYCEEIENRIFYKLFSISERNYQQNTKLIIGEYLCVFISSKLSAYMLYHWIRGNSASFKKYKIYPLIEVEIIKKAIQYGILNQKQSKQQIQMLNKNDKTGQIKFKLISLKYQIISSKQVLDIYELLKDQNCKQSITMKKAIHSGWVSSNHSKQLVQCAQRYFKDIIQLSQQLYEEHFDFFVNYLFPWDCNNLQQINRLKNISLNESKFYKISIDLANLIQKLEHQQIQCELFLDF